jgi:hypothetical protein
VFGRDRPFLLEKMDYPSSGEGNVASLEELPRDNDLAGVSAGQSGNTRRRTARYSPAELGEIDISPATVSRAARVAAAAWGGPSRLATLFVQTFRALDAIVGGDGAAAWIQPAGGEPLALMRPCRGWSIASPISTRAARLVLIRPQTPAHDPGDIWRMVDAASCLDDEACR